MKVIAIVERAERVLCEMSTIELANIAGKAQSYSRIPVTTGAGADVKKEARQVSPEDVVDVTTIFQKARELVGSYDDMKSLLSRVKGSITKYENEVKKKGEATK